MEGLGTKLIDINNKTMIKYNFWGESHGQGYGGTISGLPQGCEFSVDYVNEQLNLRKCGYGRSARQILHDIVSFDGVTSGTYTVNGDVNFVVANAKVEQRAEITALRSGHADVVGKARYPDKSVRDVAEIASARNSICYVVVGAICAQLLHKQGIVTYSYVTSIGKVRSKANFVLGQTDKLPHFDKLHCPSAFATKRMMRQIDICRKQGNSLGGSVVVGASGVPMGIGDVFPYESRLDAVIAGAFVGIPSVKGVTFGNLQNYRKDGKTVADKLCLQDDGIVYQTNNCGGIVGGITNGKDIVCTLFVKPVPTVKGVTTVDAVTHNVVQAHYERADTCVVPNVGIIAQNILATAIYNAIANKDNK